MSYNHSKYVGEARNLVNKFSNFVTTGEEGTFLSVIKGLLAHIDELEEDIMDFVEREWEEEG